MQGYGVSGDDKEGYRRRNKVVKIITAAPHFG